MSQRLVLNELIKQRKLFLYIIFLTSIISYSVFRSEQAVETSALIQIGKVGGTPITSPQNFTAIFNSDTFQRSHLDNPLNLMFSARIFSDGGIVEIKARAKNRESAEKLINDLINGIQLNHSRIFEVFLERSNTEIQTFDNLISAMMANFVKLEIENRNDLGSVLWRVNERKLFGEYLTKKAEILRLAGEPFTFNTSVKAGPNFYSVPNLIPVLLIDILASFFIFYLLIFFNFTSRKKFLNSI